MRSGIAREKAGHRGASLKVRRPNWTLLGAAFGIFVAAASAHAQNATIGWYRVANGGGVSTGNGCTIMGTVGQAEPGLVRAGYMTVAEGFWSADAVMPPLVTPAADFTYVTNGFGNAASIYITGFSSTGYADVVQEGGHLNFPGTINGYPVFGIEGFGNRIGLTSVQIPDSVTIIYGYAFEYCSGLTNVTLGTNVTTIYGAAFSFCGNLSNVTFPDSMNDFEPSAFSYCHAFTSITIPNKVKLIGNEAFFGCTSVTNLTIGSSVTSINTDAFAYCALKSVTIPASVTTFGVGLFYGCSSLTNAYFLCNPPPCNGSPGSLNTDTFYGAVGTVYYAPSTTGWGSVYGGWSTVRWTPKIAGTGYGPGGGAEDFQFNISWMPNASVVVEASTNLQSWTPVITNTLVNGTSAFTDSNWTNYPQRFYRVLSR